MAALLLRVNLLLLTYVNLQLSLLLLSTLLVADVLALILPASLQVLTANDVAPAVAGFTTVETSLLLPASLLLLFLASLFMLVLLLLLASLLLLLTY
jgi:hypothetical protein